MKTKALVSFSALMLFAALSIPIQAFAQNSQPSSASKTDAKAQVKALDEYGKLPLSFEANRGQTDSRVKFLSRGPGYSLFLTRNEGVIALKKTAPPEMTGLPSPELVEKQKSGAAQETVLRMELAGANPAPLVLSAEELPGKTNYFIGNDPAKWRTNVPTYAKVKYTGVYPGVDLVYYGNQGQLEYDFVVAPGADPKQIRLKFRGVGKLRVDEKGDLLLGSRGEEVRLEKPVVYQELAGKKTPVEGAYVLASTKQIGFRLGEYDHGKPLVIDPLLIYSTYLGGGVGDQGNSIAIDISGNAYITGLTDSTNFPTVNALQPTNSSGSYDAFVTKLNPTGSALIYSTYLGGSGLDDGNGIAVDASGNAYVTGRTSSTNFPTTNALQSTLAGDENAFVTKINPTGSALVYSTYLGGNEDDSGNGIAVDASGNAYVTGATGSTNFPTTAGGFQTALAGSENAFISKINPTGSALVYSTYLGGNEDDSGNGIALDASGNAYVTGATDSANFPTTTGAFQKAIGGIYGNAFVTKINPTGSALVYSTYLGGSGDDGGQGIAIDSSEKAYVTGYAYSTNFPTTAGAFQTVAGGDGDAFISKINVTGTALVYSTYLGGSGADNGNSIAVDASGNAYVTGLTSSTNFPTVNALQPTYGPGQSDVFVSKLNPAGTALVYSTYLGGSPTADVGIGLTVDGSANAYVTGYTGSATFPTTVGAFQTTYAGGGDAFVTKIASESTLPTTAAIPTPRPDSYGWNNTSVTVRLNASDGTGGSGVEEIEFSLSGAENLALQAVAGNTASVTISAQGLTTLTYFATDHAGNQGTAKTLTVQIDETPPVVAVTGVANGALYYYHEAPAAGCNTTDALSGVAIPASLTVTGGNGFGFGKYTATCAGAKDEAGNTAMPVSVSYTVNGPTELGALVGLKTGPLNARVWRLIIVNIGLGTAYNAEITSLSLRQTSGPACTPYLVSTLPVAAGNIMPLSIATASVTIDFAGCASDARFRVDGQVSANNGTSVGPILMLAELP